MNLIDWDAPLPERLQAKLREVLRRMFDPDRWRLGTDLGDIGAIMGIGGRSDQERLEAAKRIAGRVGRPIHSKRWDRVKRGLSDYVGLPYHKQTARAELHDHTIQRIFGVTKDAIGKWTPAETSENAEGAYREIQARLNRELAEDLIDPEWRRGCAKYWPLEQVDPIAEIERRLLLDQLVASANLSAMEKAVIQAERADVPDDQLAAQYGIAPGTIRVHRHKAHQKLQERRDLAM